MMAPHRVTETEEMMTAGFVDRSERLLAAVVVLAVTVVAALVFAVSSAFAQSPEVQDFFGTVVSVGEGVIVVTTPDGDIDVTIGAETDVRIPSEPDAGLDDLRVGDVVAVSLDESGEADKVQLIPGKTRSRHLPGEVVALSETQISILTLGASAATVTFDRDADTRVKFHQGTTELAVGDFVVIVARRDPSGELGTQALEINVTRRKPRDSSGAKPEDAQANTVEIQGVFEGVDADGNWIIDGRTILIDEDTEIGDALKVGQTIEIEGILLADGSVLAREIEAEDDGAEVKTRTVLNGVFEGLDEDGNWIISGTAVRVDETTDTDGLPAEGQRVKVKAFLQDDGSLLAREIENKGGYKGDEDDEQEREVKLEGIFEGVDDDGNWIVNGIKIAVGPLTKLEGTPAVGQEVEVKAVAQEDGALLATKVEGEGEDGKRSRSETKIRGVIEEITDEFIVIDGITVFLAALTELEGDLSVGSFVKVKAFLQEDGTLIAREVEGKGPDADEDEDERNEVEIEGTIDAVNPDGSIVVNGVTVSISVLTEVKGSLVIGATVKIEGFMAEDGSVLASEAKGEGRKATKSKNEVKIDGVVEAVVVDEDGNVTSITVNGVEVAVDPLTRIKGDLEVGGTVRVEGVFVSGVLHASEIKARGGRDEDGDEFEEDSGEEDAIKIEGTVDALILDADGNVTGVVVDGVEVSIDPADIEGALEVGSELMIEGTVDDGELVATEVELEEPDDEDDEGKRDERIEIKGVIEAVGRDADGNVTSITVDGQRVSVEPRTSVKGTIEVGADVEIDAILTDDGLVARKVRGEKDERDGEEQAEVADVQDDGEDEDEDEKIEIEGVIEAVSLDGEGNVVSITVDGREVAIGPDTDVRGTIEVGEGVEIDAVLTDDGIVARKIRVARTAADGPSEDEDSEDKDEDDNSGSGSGGSDGDSSGSGSGVSYGGVLEAALVG